MRSSPGGLVPARGFLREGMAPRPSFNDGSMPGMCSSSINFPYALFYPGLLLGLWKTTDLWGVVTDFSMICWPAEVLIEE